MPPDPDNNANAKGFVYILSNPAMPGLIKIGHTFQRPPQARIDEMYNTSVPYPFDIEYMLEIANAREVEIALHTAFAPHRINPRREFFKLEPEHPIAVLKLLLKCDGTDYTPSTRGDNPNIDDASKQASAAIKKQRPRLNFVEIGIPIGARLQFTRGDIEIEVTGEYEVKYPGEDDPYPLTAITRPLLGLTYDVQPSPYWKYNGRKVSDIYNEYHSRQTEDDVPPEGTSDADQDLGNNQDLDLGNKLDPDQDTE